MIKLSKGEAAIILLAAVFLAFTVGWFLRTVSLTGPMRVEVRGAAMEQSMVIDPPQESPEPTVQTRININTATAEELVTLPGIGEKRAADIIAEREASGLYRFPEDITRVSGIGETVLAGLLDYITTEEEP